MKIETLLVCALLFSGCASEVESSEVGGAQEALSRRSSGGLGATCPGGTSAVCVVCGDEGGCVEACAGDYTCTKISDNVCGTNGGVCRTTNAAPVSGGGIRIR